MTEIVVYAASISGMSPGSLPGAGRQKPTAVGLVPPGEIPDLRLRLVRDDFAMGCSG
jgi:hypothetical protein